VPFLLQYFDRKLLKIEEISGAVEGDLDDIESQDA
jgi:hypothetical protein